MESPADVKELIPEFFYFPEFLENMNGGEEPPSKIRAKRLLFFDRFAAPFPSVRLRSGTPADISGPGGRGPAASMGHVERGLHQEAHESPGESASCRISRFSRTLT